MASSSLKESQSAQPDWRKMNKQALRDALASRGLDTNGLRPSLIQRLENSARAPAASETPATGAVEPTEPTHEAHQKESLSRIDSQDEMQTSNDSTKTLAAVVPTLQEGKAPKNSIDSKAFATRSYVGQEKQITENGKNQENSLKTSKLTDLDRKRLRAERFGVGLQVSEQEKLALRAERFASAEAKKVSNSRESESERRKQRAARFGIVDETSSKKARQDRFAPTMKQKKSSEAEKRKARAARFGTAAAGIELKH